MIPHKSLFLLCSLVVITTMFGFQERVEACKPAIQYPTLELTLTLDPRLDAPDNCLSVAKTWGEENNGAEGYGITLVSRCGKPVEVSVQNCSNCVITTLEDGQSVDINRAEIEREDHLGQLVFLWSDGERGGKITLMTRSIPPKRRDGPACPSQNTALCTTNMSHHPTLPGGLAMALLMVGFVGSLRKHKTFKQF